MGITTKNVNTLPLSMVNILMFVSEEDIFRKYINHKFEIGEIFSAEYRVDRTPSFGVYWNDNIKKLMFNDLGKKIGGDCFKYVQISHNNCTLWEACQLINKDFNLGLGGGIFKKDIASTKVDKVEYLKERKKISITKQDFTSIDLEYWGDYGISVDTLNKYNVFSCKCYSVNGEIRRCYVDNYPIYAYYFPRTGNYKIYVPHENPFNKWATNANNDWDIMGYDQLPKEGDVLYITKSLKDVMCLYELGITSVATHGEGHWFNPDFIRHLKGRFKRIIVFYDNDEAGKICGAKIASEYDLELFYIPDKYYTEDKIKDISEFIRIKGKKEAYKLITNG